MEFNQEDLTFKHPFTAIIAGMTGSGKTVLLRRILRDHRSTISRIDTTPIKVLWAYGAWQGLYDQPIGEGVNVTYVDGLPTEEDLDIHHPKIIVIDDLMTELGGNKNLANLFTKGSHHRNISVIFIVQNIFHQGQQMRTISLNTHYFILMKNPRDKSQIYALGRQLFPENMKFFHEAYSDATKEMYGYLVIDMKQDTPSRLRIRTRLTREEIPESLKATFAPIIYVPK